MEFPSPSMSTSEGLRLRACVVIATVILLNPEAVAGRCYSARDLEHSLVLFLLLVSFRFVFLISVPLPSSFAFPCPCPLPTK